MKRTRAIKDGLEGTLPRDRVREVVRAVHVLPGEGGGWAVKRLGAQRVSHLFATQAEAVAFARRTAQPGTSKIFIHGRDGRFVDEQEVHG